MQTRFQQWKRWQFHLGIIAPTIACAAFTASAVITFVLWSANDIDTTSLTRQNLLVSHVINEQITQIGHDQESAAVWDAAVEAVRNNDSGWMHLNFGRWMSDYFNHDRTFVIDASGRPLYAMNEGETVPVAAYDAFRTTLLPLINELRARRRAGPDTYIPGGTSAYVPRVTEIVLAAGQPAIASVMPIITDTGKLPQTPGDEALLVSLVNLDADFASRLINEYVLEAGNFATTRTSSDGAAHAIQNRDGRIVAFFEWRQYRPGADMLRRTGPALAAALAVAGAIVLVLLALLSHRTAALETGRQHAEHEATHDALTGLVNRGFFDAALSAALAARQTHGPRIALMMLDLDRFKHVNDTLGHQAGDDLIRAVGQRLRSVIGPDDLLARLGGDEFAVIHRYRGGGRAPVLLSQRIIDAIGKPFEIFGSEAFVGVSVGLVIAEDRDNDQRELARRADIALYEAKATGRNRAVLYREVMNELLQNRHAIEAELREALKQPDQIDVAFQPLCTADGNIIGAEALARWRNPRLGQVSPAHFIPVAEGSGLIETLGEFVLRRACTAGAKWPGRTVAVNISPVQLRNPKFPDRVFALLRETGMRATDLELEITESILLDDEQVTTHALQTFRAAGLRIALDDFGTGYSSLNYLKRYPVDCIKIDQSFVSQLAPGNASLAIVQAMVTLAHALGISVTAEGVETPEQMEILSSMGCNIYQGYLLSPPVAQSAVTAMFDSQRGAPITHIVRLGV